ncbi:unnamed protein product, partial [Polarella glacialis]
VAFNLSRFLQLGRSAPSSRRTPSRVGARSRSSSEVVIAKSPRGTDSPVKRNRTAKPSKAFGCMVSPTSLLRSSGLSLSRRREPPPPQDYELPGSIPPTLLGTPTRSPGTSNFSAAPAKAYTFSVLGLPTTHTAPSSNMSTPSTAYSAGRLESAMDHELTSNSSKSSRQVVTYFSDSGVRGVRSRPKPKDLKL